MCSLNSKRLRGWNWILWAGDPEPVICILHPSRGMSTPSEHLHLCFLLMLESKNCHSIARDCRTSTKLYSYQSSFLLMSFPLLARRHTIICPAHKVLMLAMSQRFILRANDKEFYFSCCECFNVVTVDQGTSRLTK